MNMAGMMDKEHERLQRECVELVRKEPFYIYGTGFVARRLLDGFVYRGGIEHLRGFVVTKLKENAPHEFFGKTIQLIADIPRNSLILIAVHMIWEEEVVQTLMHLGFHRFAVIYDRLLDFQFGPPKIRYQEINVADHVRRMIQTAHSRYAMTAYLAAIRNYVQEVPGSDVYYLNFHAMMASESSARARLQRFHGMIDAYQKTGAQALKKYPVLLDEKGQVLDGLHRMSMAYAFHVPTLFADIYETQNYWGIGYEKGHWHRSHNEIFSPEELREMDALQDTFFPWAANGGSSICLNC